MHNFSKSQQEAYDAVQEGKNVFISGSAGNGKSYLTRALTTPNTAVSAPTGIAAINVGGTTNHRLFGLPLGYPEYKDWTNVSEKARSALRRMDRLIISEIGMVRTDQLDLINKKLQLIKRNEKPFGGIQVIVEGDFFQLEPIVGWSEKKIFYKNYDSPFCFTSNSWNFETHVLTEPQRHVNVDHYNLLNKLRVGDHQALEELLDTSKPYVLSEDTLHLCCYNENANNVNQYWYDRVEGRETSYDSYVSGKISEKDVIVPETVKIKEGCRVLICANDLCGEYVNGDQGTVVSFNPFSVKVELKSGRRVDVERFTWESVEYRNGEKEVVGSFTQIPLLLGYGISVHKAQGVTLDSAAIHIGKGCFSHGQFYVAVSRVRDLTNLSFLRKNRISRKDLIVKPEVLKFYNNEV